VQFPCALNSLVPLVKRSLDVFSRGSAQISGERLKRTLHQAFRSSCKGSNETQMRSSVSEKKNRIISHLVYKRWLGYKRYRRKVDLRRGPDQTESNCSYIRVLSYKPVMRYIGFERALTDPLHSVMLYFYSHRAKRRRRRTHSRLGDDIEAKPWLS